MNVVHQLGHLGIVIDFGRNEPGSVLQQQIREDDSYVWQDYVVEGKRLSAPIDVKSLPPGEYRLVR